MSEIKLRDIVRERVRQAREEQKLTQRDAGKLIGYTAQAWGDFERGDTGIDMDDLERIARALNLPVTYFIHDIPPSAISRQMVAGLFDKLSPGQRRLVVEVARLLSKEKLEDKIMTY